MDDSDILGIFEQQFAEVLSEIPHRTKRNSTRQAALAAANLHNQDRRFARKEARRRTVQLLGFEVVNAWHDRWSQERTHRWRSRAANVRAAASQSG
jgi:hypothetical protein